MPVGRVGASRRHAHKHGDPVVRGIDEKLAHRDARHAGRRPLPLVGATEEEAVFGWSATIGPPFPDLHGLEGRGDLPGPGFAANPIHEPRPDRGRRWYRGGQSIEARQKLAQSASFVTADGAHFQVGLDGDGVLRTDRMKSPGCQPFTGGLVEAVVLHASPSRSAAIERRSADKPSRILVLTVPSGCPSSAATSEWLNPLK